MMVDIGFSKNSTRCSRGAGEDTFNRRLSANEYRVYASHGSLINKPAPKRARVQRRSRTSYVVRTLV